MEPLKLIDLDLLIEEFNRFRMKTCDLVKENLSLLKQVEALQQRVQEVQDAELTTRSEIEVLQKALETAQKTITNQFSAQEENEKLKQELDNLKTQAAEREQLHKREVQDLRREIDLLEMHHVAEKARIQEATATQLAASAEAQRQVVVELNFEKERLSHQLKEVEREKEAELLKLKFEYDSKLAKLQRQAASASAAPSHMSNISQDIFRKKLQHVQMESEREISSLKQTIANLQESLATANELLLKTQATAGNKRAKKF